MEVERGDAELSDVSQVSVGWQGFNNVLLTFVFKKRRKLLDRWCKRTILKKTLRL